MELIFQCTTLDKFKKIKLSSYLLLYFSWHSNLFYRLEMCAELRCVLNQFSETFFKSSSWCSDSLLCLYGIYYIRAPAETEIRTDPFSIRVTVLSNTLPKTQPPRAEPLEGQVIFLIKSFLPGLGKPTSLPSSTSSLSSLLHSQSSSPSSFSNLPNSAGARDGVRKPGTDQDQSAVISFLKPSSASNEAVTDKVIYMLYIKVIYYIYYVVIYISIYVYFIYKDTATINNKTIPKTFPWTLNGTDK